jgi:hypothetical protein
MKPIYEYILNKDTKIIKYKEFPDTQKLTDIVKFLEGKGFIEVKCKITDSAFLQIVNLRETSITPIYMIDPFWPGKDVSWIRFCNPGETNEENPIFFIRVFNKIKKPDEELSIGFIEYNSNEIEDTQINTIKEFIKEVNKYFGW